MRQATLGAAQTRPFAALRAGLGGEARWVDDHDPSRLAALRTTPAAPLSYWLGEVRERKRAVTSGLRSSEVSEESVHTLR